MGGATWSASGPSTHLSTQHGVGSSDTHRNRLNLLFPPPPVHYYGPPRRANATLLLSSHPLPCSRSLSVCRSSFQFSLLSWFFFSLSLQKSLYKIVLFTFCKFHNPLVAVKPQDFEEATERGRRSSAEEIKVSDFCGSEEVFFRRTLCESASAHHQLGIPPVPLVCFQTRFSPHCW